MLADFGLINFGFFGGGVLIKSFLVLFLVFYSVFSLIIYRQVQLMSRAIHIPLAPILKSIAIIQIGVSLSLFFIVIGAF